MTSRHALRVLLQDLATAEQPAPDHSGQIVTHKVLTSLASSWPAAPDQERSEQLDALCRKVHVARAVKATYSSRWRTTKSSEPLPLEHWPLLIGVVLAHSISGQQNSPDAKGRAFKQLNAGFAAIDLASSLGVTDHLDELRELARKLLEGLEQEAKP